MATRLRDLLVRIRADSAEVDRELSRTASSLHRFGQQMERVGTRLSAAITLPILGAGAAALKLASDAEETRAKFDAVFREMSGSVRSWAEEQAEALNRSSVSFEGFLARLQDTFVPLGFARDRAAELSKTLASLVPDVAAFNNEADDETLRNFTSAIVGNHEAVRRYGVIITQATLKQELMRMGVADSVQAATEQEKVLARVNLLMDQTADAHGAAAQEADGYAQGLKGLFAAAGDVARRFGDDLIPLANQLQRRLTGLLRTIEDLDPGTRRWAAAIAAVAAVLGPATLVGSGLLAALSTLASVLSVSLLPLVAVGGGLLVGLGLLASHFVKNKLEAAAAAEAADRFAASLRGMTRAQLEAQRAELLAKRDEVKAEIGREEARIEGVPRGILTRAADRRIAALRTQLSELLNSYLAVDRQIRAMTAGGAGASGATAGGSVGAASPLLGGLSVEKLEVAAQGVRGIAEAWTITAPPLLRYRDTVVEVIDLTDRLHQVGINFAYAFADAIGQAVTSGMDAFRRFADYVIEQLIRVAAQFALFNILSALFPGSGFVSALGSSFGFTGSQTIAGGVSRNAVAGVGGASIAFDLSGMPPASNPLASARDADWLAFLSASGRALRDTGG